MGRKELAEAKALVVFLALCGLLLLVKL